MKKELKTYALNSQKLLGTCWDALKKATWTIGKNAFLFILIFILLDVIVTEILFYHYVFSVQMESPSISDVPTQLQESTYQFVVKELKAREKNFENYSPKSYIDPFYQ